MVKDQKVLLVRGDETGGKSMQEHCGQSASSVLYKYLLLMHGAVQDDCLLISTQIMLRKIKAETAAVVSVYRSFFRELKKRDFEGKWQCILVHFKTEDFFVSRRGSLFLQTCKISRVCWNLQQSVVALLSIQNY